MTSLTPPAPKLYGDDMTETTEIQFGPDYGFTADELRKFADVVDVLTDLNPMEDITLCTLVNGVVFRLTVGYDATGTIGLLKVESVED